ncbi:phosphotransferase family protein [Tropicibacter naphthalenivorans]|uniref:Putative aminoglycoside phosphotransferase n=1 Tax=Tropicibacter naphthalenivorans TaxID=441103 RepID=A0A0P1H292_9RHOB|nr:phosphotransferase family protein [Tropicibacter naphthalenivorans]CUH81344.1 Putative aminoglycoside phosphotransferase [Tropicibacter naphthalenivorans]SMC98463.1 Predicted kinase, aminoglycoside phosphotransferase (APT) family [Tropicibacter naphthalenivorans]
MSLDFDPARLDSFLTGHFGHKAAMQIDRIAGGQSNPTYFVTYGDARMVLRKQPNGDILRGAHAVDREYRVLSALHPTGVPVPRPIVFCDDAEVLGTPFYLMDRVEGRVFPDGALTGADPAERPALWMGLADAMAQMHAVNPADVGLGDYGKPGNYFERQINRWSRQWEDSPHDPIPELDELRDWLVANQPPDDGRVSLAHGDYRMGNVLFHPTEPRVVAILDWELSTLGHPLADLGYCCMAWHSSPDEYGGILGLDHGAMNLPSEGDFVARYMAASPGMAALTPFHIAFALFRFAVIWVGIADRVKAGTAAAAHPPEGMGAKFARRGLEVIAKAR